MDVNTSCQTDEFIAHRIGLIPFKRIGNGDTISLEVTGPCIATASDFTGPAFDPVHPTIEVMRLGENHTLKLTVFFDTQLASTHSRYNICAAVGMSVVDDTHCKLTFSSNTDRTEKDILLEALDHLEARVDAALKSLANQPDTPPKSFC